MKRRRQKSFDERRQELAGSIDIIATSLLEFERTGKVHLLRVVASQLRALVVHKRDSSSFRHPLLLELASERGFPLIVHTPAQDFLDTITAAAGGKRPVFYATGDPVSLEKDEMYNTPLPLDEALERLSVEVLGEQLSVKDVLLYIANTEASHYDPDTPAILDDLGRVELGGMATHYRVVYALGRAVRDLGIRFMQATT